MVQSLLIFALGFLAAAFVAFAVAPAIWQRAVALTRKRIEASMPLTLNEVQADKDQHRAEYAMAIRKVEIKAKALQEKVTSQMVDVAKSQERARQLTIERDTLIETVSGLEADLSGSRQTVVERIADIDALQSIKAEQEEKIGLYAAELEARDSAIVDLQIDADNKRIEIVAHTTEIGDLNNRMLEAGAVRKALEEKVRALTLEGKDTKDVARAAIRKVTELEKRNEKFAVQLADREERLARREADISTLKESARRLQAEKIAAEQLAQSTERQRQSLFAQNQKLNERTEKLAMMAIPGGADKAMKKLQDERAKLTEMVEQLTIEKDQLVERLKAATANANQDVALRDQVHDLTARIVSLSIDADGGRSPVTKLLSTANESNANAKTAGEADAKSLADRINALQQAAGRGA